MTHGGTALLDSDSTGAAGIAAGAMAIMTAGMAAGIRHGIVLTLTTMVLAGVGATTTTATIILTT